MGYAEIDTAYRAARSSGDLAGKITAALFRKATGRVVAAGDDQRELRVINAVFSGTYPATWVLAVMERLDNAGTLATGTDAQVDTAVTAVWNRLVPVSG